MDLDDPHTRSFAAFLCAKLIPGFGSMSKEEAKAAYLGFASIMMPTLKALPREGVEIDAGGDTSWREAAVTAALLLIQDQLALAGEDPADAYDLMTEEGIDAIEKAIRATGEIFLQLRGEFELRTIADDFESVDLDSELQALLESPDDADG